MTKKKIVRYTLVLKLKNFLILEDIPFKYMNDLFLIKKCISNFPMFNFLLFRKFQMFNLDSTKALYFTEFKIL